MHVQVPTISAAPRIPLREIAETRVSIPDCVLSVQVEFKTLEFGALSNLILLFTRLGLTCKCLRYHGNGGIFVVHSS